MTLCILTIIKNEQGYLEEWIKYHLKLGIDHIFIFEDINSTSHKNITDKYEKVTLNSVEKLNVEIHNQHKYLISGLLYIKEHYNYNWCFVIDIDEYITPENEIHDTMELFVNYDAVMLQWQNYGANGLIYKPNYKETGILETYTKEGEISCNDDYTISTKVVYKLKTFTKKSYFNNHRPTSRTKWCKTNFSKNGIVFDKMYLRHYITKSFEEYLWKLYNRGMFSKNHRNLDDFFSINPDMDREKILKLFDIK